MPRPTVLIEKSELQSVITAAENAQEFPNMSALCQYVCTTEWAKKLKNSSGNPVDLHHQVVCNRLKEFGIVTKTKPGKRGNSNLAGNTGPRGERKPRSEKFATNKLVKATFKELRKETPQAYQKTIDRIEKGSLKAAIRLMCLQCTNGNVGEIGSDGCLGCAISPFILIKQSEFKP